MQRGVTVWRASGFLGMSAEVPLGTYGHHHRQMPLHPSTGFRRLERRLTLKISGKTGKTPGK